MSRGVAALWVLVAGCSGGVGPPAVPDDSPQVAAPESTASDVARVVESACSPGALRPDHGPKDEHPGWTAVVFDKWSAFHWVVAGREKTGRVVIQKFFDPRPEYDNETFEGVWTWQPKTGLLRVDSSAQHGAVVDWRVRADFEAGRTSGLGTIAETIGLPAYPTPTSLESEVVVVVRRGRSYLAELDSLYECSADALVEGE